MSVTNVITQQKFYCTLVYAFNEVSDREDIWLNLNRTAASLVGPWSVGGDFNCVTQSIERLGGNVTNAEAEPFQACLDDCLLSDMPAIGAFYTWNNKKPPETRVCSRLDRMFINHVWSIQYPQVFSNFLPEGFFYHTPCVVGKNESSTSKNRSFKYYNMWSKEPEFKECVSSIWEQCLRSTKMYRVTRKLKLLKPQLKLLNMSLFSDVENKVDLAHKELIDIQKKFIHNPGDEELVRKEIMANKDFVWLHQARMKFLKQKAKAHWMTDGDANSSYFHGLLKSRRNHNGIQQIKDHNGYLYTEEQGIQQAFLMYYQLLLGSKTSSNNVIDAVVKKGRTCSEAHVLMLMQPVTQAEKKRGHVSYP
ncbi:uncharacterized protein LOC141632760 [Silene latifolia]|uniref:uncharacterized protein LOC141632760 n=1 Tax=Silene latifolia TaxID=37657 RepID=UPI003D7855DC